MSVTVFMQIFYLQHYLFDITWNLVGSKKNGGERIPFIWLPTKFEGREGKKRSFLYFILFFFLSIPLFIKTCSNQGRVGRESFHFSPPLIFLHLNMLVIIKIKKKVYISLCEHFLFIMHLECTFRYMDAGLLSTFMSCTS